MIYYTKDGGKTWSFDPSAKDLPCNLYNVKLGVRKTSTVGMKAFVVGENEVTGKGWKTLPK